MKKCILFLVFMMVVMAVTISFADTIDYYTHGIVTILEMPANDQIPEFKLPKSLTIIDDEAFEGTAIVKVDLPYTVSEIGEGAFANIKTLRSIQISTNTKKIASTAFVGSNQVTINAAPNSYARKYARTMGIPFGPVVSICAISDKSINISKDGNIQKIFDVKSNKKYITDKQWYKVDTKNVVGTLDQIFFEIKGRGPPKDEDKC